MIHRPRKKPEPCKFDIDVQTGENKVCRSAQDQLDTTKKHHQKCMGNSKVISKIHFMEMENDDAGLCGGILTPDKELTEEECCNLVRNWDKLEVELKERFKQAHRGSMKKLFESPKEMRMELQWPWYFNRDGSFSDSGIEQQFVKEIVKQSGRMRHNNFSLNVIGRCGREWRNSLLKPLYFHIFLHFTLQFIFSPTFYYLCITVKSQLIRCYH